MCSSQSLVHTRLFLLRCIPNGKPANPVMDAQTHNVTQALVAAREGNEAAAHRLWAMVYDELRGIAHRELRGERRGQTLSTTALVHDAYFKLVDQTRVAWQDRAHFYALSCRAMRQILVDHARRRNAKKREGARHAVPLEEAMELAVTHPGELLALDEALTRLGALDERLVQVVECRLFGGLSVEETAEVLGVSARTVARDWRRARAHLYRMLDMDEET